MDIEYKDRLIIKKFPSGMYEIYSDKKETFLIFDDLEDAQFAIDEDLEEEE